MTGFHVLPYRFTHEDRLAGRILWLPSSKELKPDTISLPDGCYGHPVVVLSEEPLAGNYVEFFTVTSSLPSRFSGSEMYHLANLITYYCLHCFRLLLSTKQN